MVMIREAPLLIATTPPTAAEERTALAVGAALLALFACAIPFSDVRVARSDVVVPAVSMIMFVGDCVSAVLLFGQFAVLRTRAMLVLATGYLFTAVLVVAYALTFPGPFAPTGMLGAGLQTAGWIFVMWHIGLPIAAIAYALLGGASPDAATTRAGVPVSIAIAVAVAGLVTFFTIAHHDVLPALTYDPVRMVQNKTVRAVMVAICAVAVIVLARRRRSVLDLWLLVVLFAWFLDALLTSITENRYTVAWYANRVIRVVAANIVLFVLLAESVQLYAKLAVAVLAQRRARESRMVTMEAMAAALEHEMRQPLAAITLNASAARQFLGHSPPNLAETRAAVGDIATDVERTTNILQSVRAMFADRAAAHEIVDLNALVKESVALARGDLASSEIGVQLQLADALPPIRANRPQIQEVLLNLIHNAADSMHGVSDHATVLRISTAAVEAGRVEICFADTGSGIDATHIERIFDPFFTTKPDGLGMGLAICRSIVERHGGTLSVSSDGPYGAVFRIQFPRGE